MAWFEFDMRNALSKVQKLGQEQGSKWKETVSNTMEDIQRRAEDVARTASAISSSFTTQRDNASDGQLLFEQQARGLTRPITSRDVVQRWNRGFAGSERFIAEDKSDSGVVVRDLHFKQVFLRSHALEFCIQSIARSDELRNSLLPFPPGDDASTDTTFASEMFILLSNCMQEPSGLWLQAFCLLLDDGIQSRSHAGLFKLLHGLKCGWMESYLADEQSALAARREVLQQKCSVPLECQVEENPRALLQTLNSLTEKSHASREVCRLNASLHDNYLTARAQLDTLDQKSAEWTQLENELQEGIEQLDHTSVERSVHTVDLAEGQQSMRKNFESQFHELLAQQERLNETIEEASKEKAGILIQLEVAVRKLEEAKVNLREVNLAIKKLETEKGNVNDHYGSQLRTECQQKEKLLKHHAGLMAISSLAKEAACGFNERRNQHKIDCQTKGLETHKSLVESAHAHLIVEEPRMNVAMRVVEMCVETHQRHASIKTDSEKAELIAQLRQALRARDLIWQDIDRFSALYASLLEPDKARIETLHAKVRKHKDDFDSVAQSLCKDANSLCKDAQDPFLLEPTQSGAIPATSSSSLLETRDLIGTENVEPIRELKKEEEDDLSRSQKVDRGSVIEPRDLIREENAGSRDLIRGENFESRGPVEEFSDLLEMKAPWSTQVNSVQESAPASTQPNSVAPQPASAQPNAALIMESPKPNSAQVLPSSSSAFPPAQPNSAQVSASSSSALPQPNAALRMTPPASAQPNAPPASAPPSTAPIMVPPHPNSAQVSAPSSSASPQPNASHASAPSSPASTQPNSALRMVPPPPASSQPNAAQASASSSSALPQPNSALRMESPKPNSVQVSAPSWPQPNSAQASAPPSPVSPQPNSALRMVPPPPGSPLPNASQASAPSSPVSPQPNSVQESAHIQAQARAMAQMKEAQEKARAFVTALPNGIPTQEAQPRISSTDPPQLSAAQKAAQAALEKAKKSMEFQSLLD